jgi:phage-related protein
MKALSADRLTKATAAGLRAQWKQIPHQGARALGNDIYRRVDADNEIYEFRKRDHRLLCFEAQGRVIICSHIFLKKGQKTPDAEKAKAIALRTEYFAALQNGQVNIVDDEENGEG